MISKVLLWSTEVIETFDESGSEVRLFQGRLSDILVPLLERTGKDTKFMLGFFGIGQTEVSRDEWEVQAKYFIERNR